MLEIVTALFFTLLASAIYHLLPVSAVRLRMLWVAAFSFLIVFAIHPVAALVAVAFALFSWLLHVGGQSSHNLQKYGPLSLIALLAVFSVRDFSVATDPYGSTLVQFGMSFYVLRLYLALRVAATRKEQLNLLDFLVTALFFPVFAAGPICSHQAFTASTWSQRPLLVLYQVGLLRIGIGIFALYFVTGVIGDLTQSLVLYEGYLIDWQAMGSGATYLYMLLYFLDLYANFAGYTEIAIGLGLFFGFEIPENFRYPFLATNIQKFWQRWHLSLSRFITNYIYLPLMLSLRKPRLCMFMAFVLVGMWHKVTGQYLVWGIGHGAMLVAFMSYSGSDISKRITSLLPAPLWIAVSWLMTMSLVSFLSTFANQPTFGQSMAFTQSLVMGG